ncbi:hypothetical protein [Paraburkholderia sp. SIMBA_054]|uniref:hypothetical protein n=1 Tax=Paraburkholderia sp. SIMBA_054 TaxID=3085795 RepID=UPI0039797C20
MSIATDVLARLEAQTRYHTGPLAELCGLDPMLATQWASLTYGMRRKTGSAFHRLVSQRARRPGSTLVRRLNVGQGLPGVTALYEVVPAEI